MTKNVLIPVPLVKRIIELLEYWDISGYDRAVRGDYGEVMKSLHLKLRKLGLRDAYAKIVTADDEDSRHSARIGYLWQKSLLRDFSADDFLD